MFGDSIVFNLKIPGEPKTGQVFYNEITKEGSNSLCLPRDSTVLDRGYV